MSEFPQPPRGVLFDLDGVLAESYEAWVGVLDECRVRRGMPPLGSEGVAEYWGQGIEADCELLFPGTTPAELVAEYDEAFPRYVDRIVAIPGAGELISVLDSLNLPLWVVTNSPRELAREVLRTIGVPGLVDRVSGGDDVERSKPDPEIIELGLRHIGVAASEAILVGDTSNDVQAGRAAGVFVVGLGIDGDMRIDALAELKDRLQG